MLQQRLGLSLPTIKKLGSWSPIDQKTLLAWYQYQVGITLNGSDVSEWADSSDNSFDMLSTGTEQPAYSGGVLTFVSADQNNLQTDSTLPQIVLTSDFTIGIKLNPAISDPGTILGDNTTANEFFKYTTSTNLRIKIDGSTANIPLDSGTFGDDYIVITRVSSVVTLWHNGTAQSTTATLAGNCDIDAIAVRNSDNNYLDGTISEIQIYTSSTAALTANVNARLSTL